MSERIEWDERAAHHIRTRSLRYLDAVDIEPAWAAEAVSDPERIVDEPPTGTAYCTERAPGGPRAGLGDSTGKDELMTEPNTGVTPEALEVYREEVEATRDQPLSADATRPARGRVLSVRLNPDEFEVLSRHAEQLDLPASTLVRSWILTQLRADTDTSPVAMVDRIAREVEQLRRRLVS